MTRQDEMIAQAQRWKPWPSAHDKAFVFLCPSLIVTALLAAGCETHDVERPKPQQHTQASAVAESGPAATNPLKESMPTKADFPANWHVQAQDSRPIALPGLDDADTTISAVVPNGCQEFATGFVSAPGTAIPGDFVSSTIAMIPNSEGVFDQSSVVVFATKNANSWGDPHAISDSVQSCAKVTAQMSMQGRTMSTGFTSALIDTSEIKGNASGRTTTIRASEAQILVAVVHAETKGVLVSASSMVVSRSGDDQKALLVKLVAQTVDKLNAM